MLVLAVAVASAVLPVRPAAAEIVNIARFLERCPTLDPAIDQIRADFRIRRGGLLVDAIPCTEPISALPIAQYTDELIVLQGLRVLYYMDRGRTNHLPWTPGTLYDWMKSRIRGIDVRDDIIFSYCCESLVDGYYVAVASSDDFNRDFDRRWTGISGNLGLYAHETRHRDGFPHTSGCGIPLGCDPSYDEANLSPYGIQWWLEAQWLTGGIDVGFACAMPVDVQEIASWHLSGTEVLRSRFDSAPPPALTMPPWPGGPCRTPLSVLPNRQTLRPGDTLEVRTTLAATPDALGQPVDAYIVLQIPDGSFWSYQLGGSLVPGIVPLASNVVAAPATGQLLTHTLTGLEPLGRYVWLAALTAAGTGTVLGVVDQAAFTVGP
jgi:hypothetical protein